MIERVQVRGAAPYLGMSATPDRQQVPLYSTNPDIVMRWLCDGWRCRYNQLRSRRTKWDREPHTAVPLSGKPDMRSEHQVRLECSWLAAIPAMILQSPNRIENTDWWSAIKRCRTLKKKHRNLGMMPCFKKRRDDLYFVCWHNKGVERELPAVEPASRRGRDNRPEPRRISSGRPAVPVQHPHPRPRQPAHPGLYERHRELDETDSRVRQQPAADKT